MVLHKKICPAVIKISTVLSCDVGLFCCFGSLDVKTLWHIVVIPKVKTKSAILLVCHIISQCCDALDCA